MDSVFVVVFFLSVPCMFLFAPSKMFKVFGESMEKSWGLFKLTLGGRGLMADILGQQRCHQFHE